MWRLESLPKLPYIACLNRMYIYRHHDTLLYIQSLPSPARRIYRHQPAEFTVTSPQNLPSPARRIYRHQRAEFTVTSPQNLPSSARWVYRHQPAEFTVTSPQNLPSPARRIYRHQRAEFTVTSAQNLPSPARIVFLCTDDEQKPGEKVKNRTPWKTQKPKNRNIFFYKPKNRVKKWLKPPSIENEGVLYL